MANTYFFSQSSRSFGPHTHPEYAVFTLSRRSSAKWPIGVLQANGQSTVPTHGMAGDRALISHGQCCLSFKN